MRKTDLLKPGGARGLQLNALAKAINDSEDTIQLARDQVGDKAKAFLCEISIQGKRLMEAKEMCGHGNFLPWLAAHCPLISDRTARAYMRIAANWQTAADIQNAGSIARALELCEGGQRPDHARPNKSWPAYIEALGRCAKFLGYVQKHPLSNWPIEGQEKLRGTLLPVAVVLWPEKFTDEQWKASA